MPQELGKIDMNALTMTTYDRDSIAEAVVIYDLGNTYFTYDNASVFRMVFERTTKVKILSNGRNKIRGGGDSLFQIMITDMKKYMKLMAILIISIITRHKFPALILKMCMRRK